MSDPSRNTLRKAIEEAEGYLELAVMFDDHDALEPELKSLLSQRAIAALDPVRNTAGSRAHILYLRGQAQRTAQDYEQAIRTLEESWNLDRTNIHTCLALGWCFKRVGQTGLAIEALQNALAIDRDSAIVHYNMACYLALLKQTKLAVIHLSTALEIDGGLRALVPEEPDFDPIRQDPEFQAVATVIV